MIISDVPERVFLKNENDDRRVMGQRLRPKDAHYHCITPQFQGALSLHAMYQTICTMGSKPFNFKKGSLKFKFSKSLFNNWETLQFITLIHMYVKQWRSTAPFLSYLFLIFITYLVGTLQYLSIGDRICQ